MNIRYLRSDTSILGNQTFSWYKKLFLLVWIDTLIAHLASKIRMHGTNGIWSKSIRSKIQGSTMIKILLRSVIVVSKNSNNR